MKNIIYCAIGKKELVKHAICSMKSIMVFHPNNIRFIIVTDLYYDFEKEIEQMNIGKEYEIIFHPIDPETVKNWIGKYDYIFRVKIKAMQYYFSKYDESVLFLDCDTYLKKNIDFLFELLENKYCIMGKLDLNITFRRYIGTSPLELKGKLNIKNDILYLSNEKKSFEIDLNTQYFHSVVIGMNKIHSDSLVTVEKINDILCGIHKLHAIEEMSYSIGFALNKYKIFSAREYVGDYSIGLVAEFLIRNYFGCLTEKERNIFDKFLSYLNITREQIDKLRYKEIQWLSCLTTILIMANTDIDINRAIIIGRTGGFIAKSEKDEFIIFFNKYLDMTQMSFKEQQLIFQREDVKRFLTENNVNKLH